MEIYLKKTYDEIGNTTLFAMRFFRELFNPNFEFKEFLKQCYVIGCKSLPLVTITGFIMGLVLTIQARPEMARFGAESWIPGMVSLSLIREIAPVITALICAGKISSGIGAELGSMKVTEQIDAMEVSAINPYRYLVVTRILAATLMIPILVFYADFIGIIGGFIGINMHSDVSLTLYFTDSFKNVEFLDIFPATIKTFFFGFFIGMIGCFKGFNAKAAQKVSERRPNSAVVSASLSIFIIDLIAVQLTDLFF